MCLIKENVHDGVTTILARIPTNKGDTIISLQSFDHAGTRTVFEVEGINLAEMFLVENNDLLFSNWRGLNRTVWKVSMAAGVDLALILALVFCRAEVSHAWRR